MNWSKYFFINGIKLINQRVFLLKKKYKKSFFFTKWVSFLNLLKKMIMLLQN